MTMLSFAPPIPPDFRFDSTDHSYWIGERQLPSVTTILEDLGIIGNAYYTQESAERGRLLHEYLADEDRSDTDPIRHGPGETIAWSKAAREDHHWACLEIETPRYHPLGSYAGTPDRVMRDLDEPRFKPFVVEIKTGAPCRWHQLQAAGYGSLFDPPLEFVVVHLRDDGTYRYAGLTLYEQMQARETWEHCLGVYLWKRAK